MQSGHGKRGRRKGPASAISPEQPETTATVSAKIEVIDHERDARLLADQGAWERIGRELRLLDPKRYVALLKVAEDIVQIHRDPLGAPIPSGFMLFARHDPDTFD